MGRRVSTPPNAPGEAQITSPRARLRVPQGSLVPDALLQHTHPGFTPDLEIRGELGTMLAAPKKGEQLQVRHRCPYVASGGCDHRVRLCLPPDALPLASSGADFTITNRSV